MRDQCRDEYTFEQVRGQLLEDKRNRFPIIVSHHTASSHSSLSINSIVRYNQIYQIYTQKLIKMAVTERLILPVKGDTESWKEQLKVMLQTLKTQDGYIRTRWGPHSENQQVLELLIG